MKKEMTGIFLLLILMVTACSAGPQVISSSVEMTPSVPADISPNPAVTPEIMASAASSALTETINKETVTRLQWIDALILENARYIQWSADSSRFAIASGAVIQVYETKTLRKVCEFNNQNADSVMMAAFSLNSNRVAMADSSQAVTFYELTTGNEVLKPASDPFFSTLHFSPDGKTFLTTSDDEFKATLWDTNSGEKIKELSGFETAAPAYSLTYSEDGKALIFAARATLQLVDAETSQTGTQIGNEDFFQAYALSPDHTLLAASAGSTVKDEMVPSILVYDPATGERKFQIQTRSIAQGLQYSPDGSLLVANDKNQLVFFDSSDMSVLFTGNMTGETIAALAFSPDGTCLITVSSEGCVWLWEIK